MNDQPVQSDQQDVAGKPDQETTVKQVNPVVAGLLVVGLIAVALFAVKFISDRAIPDAPGVVLNDMRSIEDLRCRFNQDYGSPQTGPAPLSHLSYVLTGRPCGADLHY